LTVRQAVVVQHQAVVVPWHLLALVLFWAPRCSHLDRSKPVVGGTAVKLQRRVQQDDVDDDSALLLAAALVLLPEQPLAVLLMPLVSPCAVLSCGCDGACGDVCGGHRLPPCAGLSFDLSLLSAIASS
jgi:hypothetical protein